MEDRPSRDANGTASRLHSLVALLREGDPAAFGLLLTHLEGRFHQLAARMLRDFPDVRRLEQTDDVLQNALIRLDRALRSVKPVDLDHFLRLAALQIRRELLTLAQRYQDTPRHLGKDQPDGADPFEQATESTWEASGLASWTELHGLVERLPEEERQVVDLLFYHGLKQEEAAEALGLSDRTVRSRWRRARLTLVEGLGGRLPGL